jgi:hypothetical protein
MDSHRARLAFALPILSLGASVASAQSLNIKCGVGPAPSSAFGAASGQAGTWNVESMPSGGVVPLVGLNGQSTSAAFDADFCDWGSCSSCGSAVCPGLSGSTDELRFFGSWFNGDCKGGQYARISGLAPGAYRMHVYAYTGCTPGLSTNIDLDVVNASSASVYSSFFTIGGVTFTGSWTNFPVGVQVFDVAAGQSVELHWGNSFGGPCGIQLEPIATIGQSFCPGDGTNGPCPCANNGSAGRGCENSEHSRGGKLYATGTTSPDTVTLTASGELSTALTIFSQGDVPISTVTFGDGLRCVGGALKRMYTKNASAGNVSAPGSGDLSITARSAALGDPIPAGGTRYYYAYYRDPNAGHCPAATFNSTSSLVLVW